MLEAAGDSRPDDLAGLIVEITEETLVHGDMELLSAIEPLRARGARLAVDDMGAGYSGLRQITTVHPGYLKLDRSLVAGIDSDGERAALVGALAGYSAPGRLPAGRRGRRDRRRAAVVPRPRRAAGAGLPPQPPRQPWPELSASSSEAAGSAAPAEALASPGAKRKALMPAAS